MKGFRSFPSCEASAAVALTTCILLGCTTDVSAPREPEPKAEVYAVEPPAAVAGADRPSPWSHLQFQNDPADFTFAIVSDLTGGYRPGVFDAAVERLNWLRPEFVLSVGDLIEGYTDDRMEVLRQWDEFDRTLEPLVAPFFYVVGNHDISNEMMKDVWRERLGRDYYHLVYRDVLFLMLNTEDPPKQLIPDVPDLTATMKRLEWAMEHDPDEARRIGEMLTSSIDWDGTQAVGISETQVAYFESVIRDNPDVRWTFLLMHKPAWQGDGNEAYARIEAALGDRPFTAFAGHTHNYKRFEVGERVHIRLGTTGGSWVVEGLEGNYDHLVLVSMTDEGPEIANLLLDGILDEYGRVSDTDPGWRKRVED